MAHLARALDVVGLDVPPPDVLRGCVGPPWPEFLPTIGVPPDRYDDVVTAYRATYDHEAPALALPFPGIPEALRSLDDAGLSLAVATSKPQHLADRIVGDGPLGRWIPTVVGADPDAGRHVKADVVGAVLDAVPGVARAATVMVGDRHHDVHGAAAHGVATVGVRWGCAPPGELEEAGAARRRRDARGPRPTCSSAADARPCSRGRRSAADGVDAAVDVDDLAGGRREPVRQQGDAPRGRPARGRRRPSPAAPARATLGSRSAKPGMLRAATVRERPGGDQVHPHAGRAEVAGQVAGWPTRAPPWPRPSSRRPARRRRRRSRARRSTTRRRSSGRTARASAASE